MKKLLFFFLLMAAYCAGSAQTDKGAWIVTLQGNMQNDVNYNEGFSHSSGLKLSGQYLVMRNLAFGASYLTSLPGASFYSFETGLFLRQYFGKYQLKPYLEVMPGIIDKNYIMHNQAEFVLKPGVGVIYWFHKKVGIDTNVNLDILTNTAVWHWNFGVNVSF